MGVGLRMGPLTPRFYRGQCKFTQNPPTLENPKWGLRFVTKVGIFQRSKECL